MRYKTLTGSIEEEVQEQNRMNSKNRTGGWQLPKKQFKNMSRTEGRKPPDYMRRPNGDHLQ